MSEEAKRKVNFSELAWIYSDRVKRGVPCLEVAYQTPENLYAIKEQFLAEPVIRSAMDLAFVSDTERREMQADQAAYEKKPHLDLRRTGVDPNLRRVWFEGEDNIQTIVNWAAKNDRGLLQELARSKVSGAMAKLREAGTQASNVPAHVAAALTEQGAGQRAHTSGDAPAQGSGQADLFDTKPFERPQGAAYAAEPTKRRRQQHPRINRDDTPPGERHH